jgi:hypothetical protein
MGPPHHAHRRPHHHRASLRPPLKKHCFYERPCNQRGPERAARNSFWSARIRSSGNHCPPSHADRSNHRRPCAATTFVLIHPETLILKSNAYSLYPRCRLRPVCHVHRRVVRPRRSRARAQPPSDRDPAQSAHPSIPDENLFMVIILHQIRGQSSQRFGCHRRLGPGPKCDRRSWYTTCRPAERLFWEDPLDSATPLCRWCPRFVHPASGHSRKSRWPGYGAAGPAGPILE